MSTPRRSLRLLRKEPEPLEPLAEPQLKVELESRKIYIKVEGMTYAAKRYDVEGDGYCLYYALKCAEDPTGPIKTGGKALFDKVCIKIREMWMEYLPSFGNKTTTFIALGQSADGCGDYIASLQGLNGVPLYSGLVELEMASMELGKTVCCLQVNMSSNRYSVGRLRTPLDAKHVRGPLPCAADLHVLLYVKGADGSIGADVNHFMALRDIIEC